MKGEIRGNERKMAAYPSGQSAEPSHKYWIEMQAPPSPGHLNGSYGRQVSPEKIKNKLEFMVIGSIHQGLSFSSPRLPFCPTSFYLISLSVTL